MGWMDSTFRYRWGEGPGRALPQSSNGVLGPESWEERCLHLTESSKLRGGSRNIF